MNFLFAPKCFKSKICILNLILVKSETEITKGTRKTTLSLSHELIFSEATDKDITEEIPSVPSLHDAMLGSREEDLKSPESMASSSSGSYSVTTDNSRGEERGREGGR